METVTGRIVKNAEVRTLADQRQVVNFSVALNEYIKPKGAAEGRNLTTYVNCAYWLSTKVAERLTKGAVVEVSGRLFVKAYMSGNEPKASLNCHVNRIKVHAGKTGEAKAGEQDTGTVPDAAAEAKKEDDLPF